MKCPTKRKLNHFKSRIDKDVSELMNYNDKTKTAHSKACCSCDKLLRYRQFDQISVSEIQKCKWAKPDMDMKSDIIQYYKYVSDQSLQYPSFQHLLLSPSSVCTINLETNEYQFAICNECNSCLKNPTFCIKSLQFGMPPKELTDLNEVELILVSQGRIDRHIFQLFGGQHKCIKLWHQMFENNVEHTMSSFEKMTDYKLPETLVCTLSGAFTSTQKALALDRIKIDKRKVLRALRWLIQNNELYSCLQSPEDIIFPDPIIIDHTEIVDDVETRIETIFETTVIFPQTGEVHTNNGGQDSKEAFLKDVWKHNREAQIISRPTQHVLPMYKNDNLCKCFPLQFPYGTGSKPPKVDLLLYLKHLVQLSIPSFQKSSLILPLFNLYAKTFAVQKASMRCNYKINDKTNTADHVDEISQDEIEKRIDDLTKGQRKGSFNTQMFVNSIFAVSKMLPFTNEAAAQERKKVFSLCTYYGMPSVFFTITPDDLENFRIRVYSTSSGSSHPPNVDSPINEIDSYLKECANIRIEYPGLCEFDFENIIDIVTRHIIGWDVDTESTMKDGGAFGNCEAFFTPVEEQGRKTLHSHFLLWIKDWNLLLKRLYSLENKIRAEAGRELAKFADAVMSTECFAISKKMNKNKTIVSRAKVHNCNGTKFIPCSIQNIRNMRYQHNDDTLACQSIASCSECDQHFDLDTLVQNVSKQLLKNCKIEMTDEDLKSSLKIILLHDNAHIQSASSPLSDEDREFFVQTLRNMHNKRHTFTCFKKGPECRSRVPNRSNEKSTVHFFENESYEWYDWKGKKTNRVPYLLELKRHPFDIFMNTYNPLTSNQLQCNCNVQLGIDGAHMMYCTCYATKSNRKEEKQAMISACESLLKQLKKNERDSKTANEIGYDPPVVSAFKKMICSILVSTQDYVVSAPLAKYMMINGSRFRSSHEFVNIPFFDFQKGKSTEAKLNVTSSNKSFISSNRDTYLYRHRSLDDLSVSEFYSNYHAVTKSKKDENEDLSFLPSSPPGYKNLSLRKREHKKIPIIYHDMMHDAKSFGGDILTDMYVPDEDIELLESFCQKVLILYMPFRSELDLSYINASYRDTLRHAVIAKTIDPKFEFYLNNMQNCRNSLNAGSMKDMVERNSKELPECDKDTKKKFEKADAAVEKYLDERLSKVLCDVVEMERDPLNSENNSKILPNIDLNNIRELGTFGCGLDTPIKSNVSTTTTHFIEMEENSSSEPKAKRQKLNHVSPFLFDLTFDRLFQVHLRDVHRKILPQDSSIEEKLKNINASGSVESIREWSKIAFTNRHGVEDIDQTQAFQSILAEFVLTYLTPFSNLSSAEIAAGVHANRSKIGKWKRQLYKLRGLDVMKNKENLVLFLTGPGGSGKSHVIKNVLLYAREFCKQIGQVFDRRTIVVTAMTGVAAVSILGETVHSALSISKTGAVKSNLKSSRGVKLINEWSNARLLIIDEISFASKSTLKNICKALEILKQNRDKHYGGIGMIFTGDFFQLEPITGSALYKDSSFAPWFEWINCFIELRGGHRFTDLVYFKLLRRLRLGTLTEEDFDLLDTRVLSKATGLTVEHIPKGTQIACYSNKDRSAMNNAVFARHLQSTHSTDAKVNIPNHTLVIKSTGHKWRHSTNEVSIATVNDIYSRCSDSDLQTENNKYIDPLLKLFCGIPLMLNENLDVPNGIANGTVTTLKRIVLKQGALEAMSVQRFNGYYVNVLEENFVSALVLELESGDEFVLQSSEQSVEINLPLNLMPGLTVEKRYKIGMKLTQFSVVVNHATTVHKLQGLTKESLFVAGLSYQANWIYVALSRIRTLDGLFLRRKISRTKKYRPHGLLVSMLKHMEHKKPIPYEMDQ